MVNNDVAVPRNLTGGLTYLEAFKAYEIRGTGKPLRIGQEIIFRTPESNVCGRVIDSSKEGKIWYALVEPQRL